jgi:hypothetical protein
MHLSRKLGMATSLLMVTSFACVHEVDAQSKGADPQAAGLADMHKRMAAAHEKMADCLASGKPAADCRQTMASTCAGIEGCVMQDGMGMGMMGMHGRRGMMMENCPGVSGPSDKQKSGK